VCGVELSRAPARGGARILTRLLHDRAGVSGWSPPALSRRQLAAVGLLIAVSVVYSVFVAAQLLLVLGPAVLLVTLYFAWRLLLAVEAIADALQRIADAQSDTE
jgi:hypothetical protein